MIIVLPNGTRRRFPQFQVWRQRGERPARYYLMLQERWHIPLQYNGDLAMTGPDRRDCYDVSFNQLPVGLRFYVQRCVQRILDKGTPIERDEHVYLPARDRKELKPCMSARTIPRKKR